MSLDPSQVASFNGTLTFNRVTRVPDNTAFFFQILNNMNTGTLQGYAVNFSLTQLSS